MNTLIILLLLLLNASQETQPSALPPSLQCRSECRPGCGRRNRLWEQSSRTGLLAWGSWCCLSLYADQVVAERTETVGTEFQNWIAGMGVMVLFVFVCRPGCS